MTLVWTMPEYMPTLGKGDMIIALISKDSIIIWRFHSYPPLDHPTAGSRLPGSSYGAWIAQQVQAKFAEYRRNNHFEGAKLILALPNLPDEVLPPQVMQDLITNLARLLRLQTNVIDYPVLVGKNLRATDYSRLEIHAHWDAEMPRAYLNGTLVQ